MTSWTQSRCRLSRRALCLLALGLAVQYASLPAQAQSGGPAKSTTTPVGSGFRRSPPLKPPARPTGDPRLASFDSPTRMLIETELRAATPTERNYWLTLLATVQSDQVPYLLAARRQASQGRASSPPSSVSPATITPADSGNESHTAVAPNAAPAVATGPPITRTSATTASAPVEPTPASATDSTAPTLLPPDAPSTTETPATQRRWIAPLRGRWSEGRHEEDAAVEVAPSAAIATSPSVPQSASAGMRSSAYMNVELQRVMTLLRTELEEAQKTGLSPTDPQHRRLQVQMRLLQMLADEPELAVQAIPGLPAAEQEFWIQLLLAMANELSPPGGQSDSERLQHTSTLLAEAERNLRQAAPLELRNPGFCHRINSFGSYDRFPQDEFVAGQPVLLYVEIRNFHSELADNAGYRSRLRTLLQIYSVAPDGSVPPTALPVDRREFPATEDFCRSIRTDYFHSYRLDLPVNLTPGHYVLRLTMADELSDKQATTDVPFAVR